MFIVLTQADKTQREAERINKLFDRGLPLLHLRKPLWNEDELSELLTTIDPQHYPKISLHQQHQLAPLFGIRRLHFTEKERLQRSESDFQQLKKDGFLLSTSLHSMKALENLSEAFEYTFIGPVFDSISKPAYRKMEFASSELIRERSIKLIALGGISSANAAEAMNLGFDGIAVLGAIWQNPEPLNELKLLLKSCLTSVR